MRARWKFIFSAVVFGTLGPFIRAIPLASGELALYRACLASALIGAYLLVRGKRRGEARWRRELPLLFASGLALGLDWAFLFESYRYTSVSAATLSYYFAPILVTLVCPVLFKERLTGRQMLCFAASTVGVILIVGSTGLSATGTDLRGVLLALCAAVFYAAVIVINKAIKGVAGVERTFLQFAFAIVVLLPYVAATGGFHLSGLHGTGLVCLLVVGLFHTGFTYCLYFSSLKELPGQEAAILSYIDPLTAVVISALFLRESVTPAQLIGGGLILVFSFLNERG